MGSSSFLSNLDGLFCDSLVISTSNTDVLWNDLLASAEHPIGVGEGKDEDISSRFLPKKNTTEDFVDILSGISVSESDYSTDSHTRIGDNRIMHEFSPTSSQDNVTYVNRSSMEYSEDKQTNMFLDVDPPCIDPNSGLFLCGTEQFGISGTAAAQNIMELVPNNENTSLSSDNDNWISARQLTEENSVGYTPESNPVVPGVHNSNPKTQRIAQEDLKLHGLKPRSQKTFVPEHAKDERYWKRRNKNNTASKISRCNRRKKDNEIVMRVAFLETENNMIRSEVELLRTENTWLQQSLCEARKRHHDQPT